MAAAPFFSLRAMTVARRWRASPFPCAPSRAAASDSYQARVQLLGRTVEGQSGAVARGEARFRWWRCRNREAL